VSKFAIHRAFPFVVGVFICMVMILYPAHLMGVFDPVPYQDVRVTSVKRANYDLKFTANFVKRGCEFQKLGVSGVGFEEDATPLKWWDTVDQGDREANRMAGRQTMGLTVRLIEGLDEIEVKTRHDCNGQTIDRVFAVIPVPG